MKKPSLSLVLLAGLCLARLAAAETDLHSNKVPLTTPGGHWAITRERPVDQNKNGRIDRNEWKAPDSQRPWNRPQFLEGQTQRWNVQWQPQAPGAGAQAIKL